MCFLNVCIWLVLGLILGFIFDLFSGFRKRLSFGFASDHRNIPENSSFYFHESRYNFAKLYRSSKLLPERMALLSIALTPFIDDPSGVLTLSKLVLNAISDKNSRTN